MAEEDRLTGRAKRYVQVAGAMGGLAARLAGERYFGVAIDRDRHAADLRAALGGIKGPLMKAAQLLSAIPDALPQEYAAELAGLQADAPAMGWPFVRRRMAAELGPDWAGRFASFEHHAAHAASLGQVHRAVHPDGRRLAVKLQYPDMASAVEADLKQLKLAMQIYERIDGAVRTAAVFEEIAERLREELDYRLEARRMRLYRTLLADAPDLHVPEAIPELSTGRLLTMTWLDGAPLPSLIDAPQEVRDQAARNLFHAWYRPFYRCGVIHGDPHPGNYAAAPDGGLNLLDFGCVRVFAPDFVASVIDLFWALERDDADLAAHAYARWGFTQMSQELMAALNLWARFLYAPLLDDRVRTVQGDAATPVDGPFGRAVAEQVHAALRKLGGVATPREFVFMDRAAVGLGAIFMRLKAAVNWRRIFLELIEGFDPAAMARTQADLSEDLAATPTGSKP